MKLLPGKKTELKATGMLSIAWDVEGGRSPFSYTFPGCLSRSDFCPLKVKTSIEIGSLEIL